MSDRNIDDRIVSVDDGDWTGEDPNGGLWRRLDRDAGGEQLGCTIEAIPPGGRPARYHYHLANEEAMYVIDGRGTLSHPDGETEVNAGEYVAFPAGESGAHAIENTSDEMLCCLFVSTNLDADVIVYPDDGTVQMEALGATFPLESARSTECDEPTEGNRRIEGSGSTDPQ